MESRIRESGIECLRLFAMLLVLVVHANFFSLGEPAGEDIVEEPWHSFNRVFVQSLAIVCVNVFVMISGWFGLHPTWKKLMNFLYQLLFFFVLIYVTLL